MLSLPDQLYIQITRYEELIRMASRTVPNQAGGGPLSVSAADGFDLDVSLVEIADPAGLVNVTDDNCGSTCGACTTNVA